MTVVTDLNVIGLGYVGLPTAVMFASAGLTVCGVDIDPDTVKSVNAGRAHIVEPGLADLLETTVASGALTASCDVVPASAHIIAVPTPLTHDRSPDLSFVEDAARSIAGVLRPGDLVVLESTSPVGATEQLGAWIQSERDDLEVAGSSSGSSDATVAVAYCPERVLPGNVLHELVANDRLIGGLTSGCANRAAELYRRFSKGDCRLTTARTAELAKLTENAFRDVNIAFANELSVVADDADVDVWELIELANLHPRVSVLRPGPGVGGHCIAVDPWFIAAESDRATLITTARQVNDAKPGWVADKVIAAASGINEPVIACLGLAYKPDIDDFRESPSIEVVRELCSKVDGRILVVEPNAGELPEQLQGYFVELVELDDALARADVVVGLVGHREFQAVSSEALATRRLVDPAGVFRRDPWQAR